MIRIMLDTNISEDNATMLNKFALRAYSVVNPVLKLISPKFIGFGEFTEEIKRCVSL